MRGKGRGLLLHQCAGGDKNQTKQKKPTRTFQEISHIPHPDSSEPTALIADWLGSLSGLETSRAAVGVGLPPTVWRLNLRCQCEERPMRTNREETYWRSMMQWERPSQTSRERHTGRFFQFRTRKQTTGKRSILDMLDQNFLAKK